MKKLGIIGIIIGLICIGSSLYIKKEVKEGQKKISSAEGNVDHGTALFSITPYTKDIGEGLSSPFRNKIDEGKKDVRYYNALSNWLMIGGIVFIVGGVVLVARKKH